MNAPKSSTRTTATAPNVALPVDALPLESVVAFVVLLLSWRLPQPLRTIFCSASLLFLAENIWVRFWVKRARRLNREHKTVEAHTAFRQTLQFLPPWRQKDRFATMVSLATSAYMSGQLPATILWAERAIEYSKSLAASPFKPSRAEAARRTTFLRCAHSMAGVGYSSQDKIETAEAHYRSALKISRLQKNVAQQADCLGILAGLLKKQGRMREALAAAERAQTLDKGSRSAAVVEVETLRDMGRFDEARRGVERALQIRKKGLATYENYQFALNYLMLAYIEAAAEQPDAGLIALEKARRFLTDVKMCCWMDALETLFLAQQGLQEASRRLAEKCEAALVAFPDDSQTQRVLLASLGRSAFARGEWNACRRFNERYLEMNPLPVNACSAYYYLGECARCEGEKAAAKSWYKKVVAHDFEIYHCAWAKMRLEEMTI